MYNYNIIYHNFLPSFLKNIYLMTFYGGLLKYPSIRSIFVFLVVGSTKTPLIGLIKVC